MLVLYYFFMLEKLLEKNTTRRAVLKLGLAGLAALTLGFSNPVFAGGENPNNSVVLEEKLEYDGIIYTEISPDSNVYVPKIASPKKIAGIIYRDQEDKEVWNAIKESIEMDTGVFVDELRFGMSKEQYVNYLKDMYLIASENDGDTFPRSLEEAYDLRREYGPVLSFSSYVVYPREDSVLKSGNKKIIFPETSWDNKSFVAILPEEGVKKLETTLYRLELIFDKEGNIIQKPTIIPEGDGPLYDRIVERNIKREGLESAGYEKFGTNYKEMKEVFREKKGVGVTNIPLTLYIQKEGEKNIGYLLPGTPIITIFPK